jgi:hypothetical protein
MLFEKINLEKLTRQELVILIQALSDYNDNYKTKNHEQIESFLDRVSDQIQSIDRQIIEMKGDI